MSDMAVIRYHDLVGSLDELLKISSVLHKSGLLPREVKSPEAAAAIILKGREIGMPMMESFALINIISGKPSLAPQGMLALVYRSHELESMLIEDDGQKCTVTMKRKGHEIHSESFSMEDANLMMTSEWVDNVKRVIPLAKKSNWVQMPTIMRKWRAVSACCRIVFPDVIGGMYTPDELGAEVDIEGEIVRETLADKILNDKDDFDQRPEAERKALAHPLVDAAKALGGEVKEPTPPPPPDTFKDYAEGVLAYRKWERSGKLEIGVFGFMHPAHEQIGKALNEQQKEHILSLFAGGRNELVHHMQKHFKKASGTALTWEELAAMLAWKEDGKPDPRWYADKIAEKANADDKQKMTKLIINTYAIELPETEDAQAFIADMLTLDDPTCLVPTLNEYGVGWRLNAEAMRSMASVLAQKIVQIGTQEFKDLCDSTFLAF